jgi:hypothetical protein
VDALGDVVQQAQLEGQAGITVGSGAADRAAIAEREPDRVLDRKAIDGVITTQREVSAKRQRADLVALADRPDGAGRDQAGQQAGGADATEFQTPR